ncbi:hypothetical protein FKW77_004654 [Venturia effusa]|uniref:Uncharacterized protein n=1 Tax=Venturia effusa TaxID=50376 RepID=A0A517LNU5_9PEZI|nr:hypothetical protein FKW77_004654 [Venturia effusa]
MNNPNKRHNEGIRSRKPPLNTGRHRAEGRTLTSQNMNALQRQTSRAPDREREIDEFIDNTALALKERASEADITKLPSRSSLRSDALVDGSSLVDLERVAKKKYEDDKERVMLRMDRQKTSALHLEAPSVDAGMGIKVPKHLPRRRSPKKRTYTMQELASHVDKALNEYIKAQEVEEKRKRQGMMKFRRKD